MTGIVVPLPRRAKRVCVREIPGAIFEGPFACFVMDMAGGHGPRHGPLFVSRERAEAYARELAERRGWDFYP